jgi:DNA-binding transcriptional MerR regulator/methylmalonyl-CoA mutase cobalamin-binding subunit
MRMVTQRTGLSSHVVRVWERRYGAVVPERTDSNRRLYSEEDVRRLGLMAKLTKGGNSISQIASLPTASLEKMVRELPPEDASVVSDATADSERAGSAGRNDDAGPLETYLKAALRSIQDLDSAALHEIFNQASLQLGGSSMIEKLMVPLIEMIGEKWDDGSISVAQEHAASAVIKEILLLAGRPHSESRGAPNLLVATPAGQLHELGAMLVACTARRRGWSVTYLGPSLPADEIAAAAKLKESSAVALSIVYPGDDAELPGDLKRLRELLSDECAILAGGRCAGAYAPVLEEIGAVQLAELDGFKQWLDQAREGRQLSSVT